MSTLIDLFAQFVQRGKDAAVKAGEVWPEASDEAFAKLTDSQERFGTPRRLFARGSGHSNQLEFSRRDPERHLD
jgi:hypothetical protein